MEPDQRTTCLYLGLGRTRQAYDDPDVLEARLHELLYQYFADRRIPRAVYEGIRGVARSQGPDVGVGAPSLNENVQAERARRRRTTTPRT